MNHRIWDTNHGILTTTKKPIIFISRENRIFLMLKEITHDLEVKTGTKDYHALIENNI